MTKHWGPIGWATLHSIAALYPDTPSDYEKHMILRWMHAFRDTILCAHCQSHFAMMFDSYIQSHPYWWNSRKYLSEFVFRAHNTVNLKNRTRIYSFEESLEELEKVFPSGRCSEVRKNYLVYIRNDWMRNMTIEGITSFSKIKELNSMESDYWDKRPAFTWSDLLQFAGSINVFPLYDQVGSTLGGPGFPKITAPAKGFSLKVGGGMKIGGLRSLR
jgi:hypothetical protein